jgi:hypothetical protein
VEKTEGKGPLGKHRRKWKDNIKIDLQEVLPGVNGMILLKWIF